MIITTQIVKNFTFIMKQKLIVSSANPEFAFAVVFDKIQLFSSFKRANSRPTLCPTLGRSPQ